MNLIIDVGNTRIKAAVFENDSLIKVFVFDKEKMIEKVQEIIKKYAIDAGIVSSVVHFSTVELDKLRRLAPFVVLSHQTKVPFVNRYKSPSTLGVDRIALIAAAVNDFPKSNVLVIDAGTCITFDFVNSKQEYLGGAISLGIKMRYEALNKFTSKLPLLELKMANQLIGSTTEDSIHSGVVNGVLNEIKGVIEQYEKENTNLTIVLTGGDTNFLAKQLKSSIFANPNFVLEGLNTILTHTKEEC